MMGSLIQQARLCVQEGDLTGLINIEKKGLHLSRRGVSDIDWLLFSASEGGHFDILDHLITSGLPTDKEAGRTSFMRACRTNDKEMLDYLIANGTNINPDYYVNCLGRAYSGEHFELAGFLLNLFDDPNGFRELLRKVKGDDRWDVMSTLLTAYPQPINDQALSYSVVKHIRLIDCSFETLSSVLGQKLTAAAFLISDNKPELRNIKSALKVSRFS